MYATRSLSFEDTQPLPDRSKARTNTWNKLDSLTGCALVPDEFPNASEPLQFHSVKSLADLRLTAVQCLIDLLKFIPFHMACGVLSDGQLAMLA